MPIEFHSLSVTGIAEESIFNEVLYFHVVENYSVDIMHDLLEGVYPIICVKFFYF